MRFECLTPAGLKELRVPLVELYRQCFAQPPWYETDVQFYEDILDQHFVKPGLVAVAAYADGDELAGLVYGWQCPAEYPSDDPFHQTVPESARPYMVAPTVTVAELMVHPEHQRKGIGRELLSQYIDGRRHAWLVTHPEAPARALYDSMGWQAGEEFVNHRGDPRVFYFRRT